MRNFHADEIFSSLATCSGVVSFGPGTSNDGVDDVVDGRRTVEGGSAAVPPVGLATVVVVTRADVDDDARAVVDGVDEEDDEEDVGTDEVDDVVDDVDDEEEVVVGVSVVVVDVTVVVGS